MTKQEIELAARAKFKALPDGEKKDLANLLKTDVGMAQIWLRKRDFSIDEAARLTIFIIGFNEQHQT